MIFYCHLRASAFVENLSLEKTMKYGLLVILYHFHNKYGKLPILTEDDFVAKRKDLAKDCLGKKHISICATLSTGINVDEHYLKVRNMQLNDLAGHEKFMVERSKAEIMSYKIMFDSLTEDLLTNIVKTSRGRYSESLHILQITEFEFLTMKDVVDKKWSRKSIATPKDGKLDGGGKLRGGVGCCGYVPCSLPESVLMKCQFCNKFSVHDYCRKNYVRIFENENIYLSQLDIMVCATCFEPICRFFINLRKYQQAI